MDEFRLYYDVDMANTPVLVGRVGPGLTGYHDDGGMNFGYQVLTIDGKRESSTFAVLDIETRILNLTGKIEHSVIQSNFFILNESSSESEENVSTLC